jgi:quercetin dioxygenase-like cupin family protein
MSGEAVFPEFITTLPEADIPIEGVHGNLLQGEDQQVIFMVFERDVEVPQHAHEAQWGVVLDGEIDVTIGGVTRTCRKGDSYFIPKDVQHSAQVRKGYKDITVFNQRDRYKEK